MQNQQKVQGEPEWPYCCRKEAEQSDLQQCKLTVKEESTVT